MSRRDMTENERGLWRLAVRDVKPMNSRGLIAAHPPASLRLPVRPSAAAPRLSPGAERPRSSASHRVFGGGDPARDRGAGTARLPIDRVIDLHGLTQVEARRVVSRLIEDAAASGARLCLVITGKGRRTSEGARAGVLRAAFLDWVEAAPLRNAIARVCVAKPAHGGAGAFYVFLKNPVAHAPNVAR